MLTKSIIINKPYATPVRIWIVLGVISLILGALIIGFSNSYRERLLNEVYHNASYELSATASSLSSILGSRLMLSNGLNAYVSAEINQKHVLDQTTFVDFAASFIHNTKGIRNLSVYPDGIAKFVYPLDNNEALLGLNLFTHPDPNVRLNAERTMLTTDMTFLGPIDLAQGGVGILSRQSVFEGYRFWGFVSVVLDVRPILEEAGFFGTDKGINLALRANNQVITGDPQFFNSMKLRDLVALPEGTWELSASPKKDIIDSVYFKVLGVQILLLYIIYVQLTQKARLKALVKARTLSLELANKQLKATHNELASTEQELREQYELLESKEQVVRHMAYHDSVTGLYNRAYFNDYLEKIISINKHATHRIAVLFLNLDHFR